MKVGDIAGFLTVQDIFTVEKWGRKIREARCVCVCGNTTQVRVRYLKKGKTVSCGCASMFLNGQLPPQISTLHHLNPDGITPAIMLEAYMGYRGVGDCDLTIEDIQELCFTSDGCYLCGKKEEIYALGRHSFNQGHTRKNVETVCWDCDRYLRHSSIDELLEFVVKMSREG